MDYGNTECQERDGLKTVHPKLMNLPAQAIFCGLSGILSPSLYKVNLWDVCYMVMCVDQGTECS